MTNRDVDALDKWFQDSVYRRKGRPKFYVKPDVGQPPQNMLVRLRKKFGTYEVNMASFSQDMSHKY